MGETIQKKKKIHNPPSINPPPNISQFAKNANYINIIPQKNKSNYNE